MPSLIVASVAAANKKKRKALAVPSPTADAPSTTPKKAASGKSQVTPASSPSNNKKKRKTAASAKDQQPSSAASTAPVKKQVTMLSFFGARKPASKKKPVASTPIKPPPAMKAVQKPDAVGVDKESLREIVVGAVLSPFLKNKAPLLMTDYDKYKGSPMPTNFTVPSITRQKRFSPSNADGRNQKITSSPVCLLERLNENSSSQGTSQGSAAAPPLAQPDKKGDDSAAGSQVISQDDKPVCMLPTQLNEESPKQKKHVSVLPTQFASGDGEITSPDVEDEEEVQGTPTNVHEILALRTQVDDEDNGSDESSDDMEEEASPQAHEFVVAPTQGGEDDSCDDEDDDDKTVCFSDTESLHGDNAAVDKASQLADDVDASNGMKDSMLDMTQPSEESEKEGNGAMTQPNNDSHKESSAETTQIETSETSVDLTQLEPNDGESLHQDDIGDETNSCVADLSEIQPEKESLTEDMDLQQASQKEDIAVIEDEPESDKPKSEKPKKRVATIAAMFSAAATSTKTTTRPKKRAVLVTADSTKPVVKTPRSRKKAPTKHATPTAGDSVTEVTKSPARLARMKTNDGLRLKTIKRLSALTERVSEGIEEEVFDLPDPSSVEVDTFGDELSQQAVIKLALIVQGSELPLSLLASKAFDSLKGSFGDSITLDSVTEKIKMYFTRENYISCSATEMRAMDKFQDTADRMWRWEIMSLELLPDDVAAKVRKAQTARKRLRSHSKALVTLRRTLDEADKVLIDATCKQEQCDKLVARVNNAEENVLKFERAAEKVRLMKEAKRKKEEAKQLKLVELKKERDQKKEEAAKKKGELTKKKEVEAEKKMAKEAEKKRKEERNKVSALTKNKARLMTFFVAKSSNSAPMEAVQEETIPKSTCDDPVDYLKLINSVPEHNGEPLFAKLSQQARLSVKRRTKRVPVTVDVTTVIDVDNTFNQQNYAEQRTILFPNKYKFLSFVEDYRPAYHGTWSKSSKLITGKTPFRQDKAFLNYDEDSEAEWEEGDDEIGEDLQDEAADGEEENMDEEGDTRIYNFEDGWMAEDDDVVYENEEIDDETKQLRKKLKSSDAHLSEELVAPFDGGLPLLDAIKGNANIADLKRFIHVSDESQVDRLAALKLPLLATEADILSTDDVCLDAFPPTLVDENFVGDPSSIGAPATTKSPANPKMTKDDIKEFAEFVHHSTYASKDRLVEELRTIKPKITSSRAQALRKLDSIAVKKKNPVGGVIWDVKRGVLEEMGLKKQLAMKMPEAAKKVEPIVKSAKKPTKAKHATNNKEVKTIRPKPGKKPKNAVMDTIAVKSDKKEKSENRKRKQPPAVSAASAALFAKFIAGNKKPKAS